MDRELRFARTLCGHAHSETFPYLFSCLMQFGSDELMQGPIAWCTEQFGPAGLIFDDCGAMTIDHASPWIWGISGHIWIKSQEHATAFRVRWG